MKKTTAYLHDFHCNLANSESSTLYPLSAFVKYSNLSDIHRHYNLQMSVLDEPKNYKQAI